MPQQDLVVPQSTKHANRETPTRKVLPPSRHGSVKQAYRRNPALGHMPRGKHTGHIPGPGDAEIAPAGNLLVLVLIFMLLLVVRPTNDPATLTGHISVRRKRMLR